MGYSADMIYLSLTAGHHQEYGLVLAYNDDNHDDRAMAERLKANSLATVVYDGHNREQAYRSIEGKKGLDDILKLLSQIH